jgi:hypothetical protein
MYYNQDQIVLMMLFFDVMKDYQHLITFQFDNHLNNIQNQSKTKIILKKILSIYFTLCRCSLKGNNLLELFPSLI